MTTSAELEVRCSNCNDVIDTSHIISNCLKCGEPIAGYVPVKNPSFVSNPAIAFLIALIVGITVAVIIAKILGLIGIGGIFIQASVAVVFVISIGVYKALVGLGE